MLNQQNESNAISVYDKKLNAIKYVIDSLKGAVEGLEELCSAEAEIISKRKVVTPVAEPEETPKEEVKSQEKVEEPAKEVETPEPEEVEEEESVEDKKDDLESMTDTELKALAKDMGIKIKLGMKRQRIIDAIREKVAEEKEEPEEVVEEKEELPEDDLMKRIKEETADMTDDELREILDDAGISEKGDRTALLSKLRDAIDKGLIEFGDDEDSPATEEDAEDAIVNEGDEKADEDTPERVKAMETFELENREAFEKGQLEVSDMKAFLKENFNLTLPKKATPAEVLDAYIEHAVNFIDDSGETVEEGAYTVRGIPFCCGVPLELKKDKEGRTIAKCNICGESYDITEEE